MPYVIVAIIVIWLAYLLIRYVLIPVFGFLAVAAPVIGAAYALVVSLISFVKSLIANINPYDTYVDNHKDVPAGIRRNYFFGPGLHQIASVAKGAFANQKRHLDKLSELRSNMVGALDGVLLYSLFLFIWIFYIIAFLSTIIIGSLFVAIFSILLFSVIFTGMSIFFLFFSLLWFIDRYILMVESIQSRCPNDKRISIVPVFVCPNCGMEHRKLTPGPYGVFKRKCTCGKLLSTTFINGRSKLQARCPYCNTDLAVSDARQIGIQMVGGTKSGKTTFLAAFLHLYLEKLNKLRNIFYKKFPVDEFEMLESGYQQGVNESTYDKNATMYSIIHNKKRKSYQLTIYDIAGEAFTDLGSRGIQQQQFKYCEGIIFIIDPTESPNIANEAISSFTAEFKGLRGKHAAKVSKIPIAVLISKSDLFKQEIGIQKIQSCIEGKDSFEQTRSRICREFLENNNFGNALNLVEGEYNNVQYFPISAIGHDAVEGQAYEPWGVMEPAIWVLDRGSRKNYSDEKKSSHFFTWIKNPISMAQRGIKFALYTILVAFFAAIMGGAMLGLNGLKLKYNDYKMSSWVEAVQSPTSVISEWLDVYEEPSANDDSIVDKIPQNTKVAILERNIKIPRAEYSGDVMGSSDKTINSSWVKISYGDEKTGYVNSDYLYRPGLYLGDVYQNDKGLEGAISWIRSNAKSGDNYKIVLGKDEAVKSLNLSFNNNRVSITLEVTGSDYRNVQYGSSFQPATSLFTVRPGVTFIMEKGVNLVGRQNNTQRMVTVDGGSFIMNGGTIKNNKASNDGGGVVINSGSFTMNNGSISGNASANGGGVYLRGGTFTMNDGFITGNTAHGSGGGIQIYGGTFTMYDGTINANAAAGDENEYGGGGVSVYNGANFIMHSGTITRNSTNRSGGGVFVNNGSFTINNGTISDNTANNRNGGGVYIAEGTLIMNNGTISGNFCKSYGGGVSILRGSFRMNNGVIGSNRAQYGGGIDVTDGSTFVKSSGIIYGSNSANNLANRASNNNGHAVVLSTNNGNVVRVRNSTAGATLAMDSSKRNTAGGWQ